MKKYKLTDNKINGLFQIQALIDIPEYEIKKGDLGGFIESESNLSHNGNAWVSDNALVYGNATVCGNAIIKQTKDYMTIGPIGDNRHITITKSNKMVHAGCFNKSFEEFKEAVDKKYKGEGDYYHCFGLIKKYLEV